MTRPIRQIILDTETTGLSPQAGHRLIEIGCVELLNRQRTARQYQIYLNPEREVEEGAFRVHGIHTDFLKDKPLFSEIVQDFIGFIEGADEIIIHNAAFDKGFINAELARLQWPKTLEHYAPIFDTLVYARQKHRGARNTLDALCKRYQIKHADRALHGALLDAEILASVYLAMTGGQIDLFSPVLETKSEEQPQAFPLPQIPVLVSSSPILYASAEELAAHVAFMGSSGR